ncbi:PAS domain-containing protein [Peribacillus butanolivorans]|uniref:helix-turn-helix transcriptional regulator n=1 Tax=Peribacillus butanolivorans TaxID=421767 RepID=UPI00207C8053|nr:PAS domain-containing protein [Peribacillus butanolivorans]MCO0599996.1 PAS domain-containing protein [Peribacillus butanolivorans]
MSKIMDYYKELVGFLGLVMGENCEIALQDVSDEKHCIVAIANGHISGRKVGSPLTDLALKFIKSEVWKEKDYICNYTGKTRNNKILNSSTFFIKENGKLLGMFCVNIDNSKFIDLSQEILRLGFGGGIKSPSEALTGISTVQPSLNTTYTETENFFENPEDIVNSVFKEFYEEKKIPTDRLTQEEKMELIERLESTGVFNLKGSISHIADKLMVSEASVYRYRSKLQKMKQGMD